MSKEQELFRNWWRGYLRPDEDTGAARARRARLRRADTVLDVLAEACVHDLAKIMPSLQSCPGVLARIATVLAWVERDDKDSLARRLGEGEPRALSPLRFEKLMRSSRDELSIALRRALPMVDNRCNVGNLACDIRYWGYGEKTRRQWWFDYYRSSENA